MNASKEKEAVLVTGAGGYIGRLLVEELSRDSRGLTVVATDVRETPEETAQRRSGETAAVFALTRGFGPLRVAL